MNSSWWLYILDCDGRFYTGVTTDTDRRLAEHRAGGSRSARFTRGARRIGLCYRVELEDRGEALRAEARLRKLRRAEKQLIVREQPDAPALRHRLDMA
jgi:putative endonuclease